MRLVDVESMGWRMGSKNIASRMFLCSLAFLASCSGQSIFQSQVPAPTGLVAVASSTTLRVQLNWNSESAASGGFEVWRGSSGSNPLQIAACLENSYIDLDAPAGSQLVYTVRGVDSAGAGVDSNPVTVTTIPGAPSQLHATQISENSISLGWTEAAGAEGDDSISYTDSSGVPVSASATGQAFTADHLSSGSAYLFTISARNATGSGPSASIQIATLLPGAGGGSGGGQVSGGGSGGSAKGGGSGGSANGGGSGGSANGGGSGGSANGGGSGGSANGGGSGGSANGGGSGGSANGGGSGGSANGGGSGGSANGGGSGGSANGGGSGGSANGGGSGGSANGGGSGGSANGGGSGGSANGGGSGGGSGGGTDSADAGPIDAGPPSTNGDGTLQCTACEVTDDCIAGAVCIGSTYTGMSDGTCEVGCDPNNSQTIDGINFYTDCVTAQCNADLTNLNLTAAAIDCLQDYSLCNPIGDGSLDYCVPAFANCGATTTQ